MPEAPNHPTTQQQQQEHEFLDYLHADIYFMFSFSWHAHLVPWDKLRKGDAPQLCGMSDGWQAPRLHERVIHDPDDHFFGNYQPNLVTNRRVLERSQTIQTDATLALQTVPGGDWSDANQTKRVRFRFGYTVRLYDDGSGVCTFQACLKKEKDENGAMFEGIHAVLHLARNVDYEQDQEHSRNGKPPLTNARLLVPTGQASPKEDWGLFPGGPACTLHDLFRKFLTEPPTWGKVRTSSGVQENLWFIEEQLDDSDSRQDFQTPYILTAAEVKQSSYDRFRQSPTIDTAREVASIMCRQTEDNRRLLGGFRHMSRDYISKFMNSERGGLSNLCLDGRLFFSFSKRGGIALTSSFDFLPATFVVPSLANLLEIIRARWHMCCILNLELDDLADKVDEVHQRAATSGGPIAPPGFYDKLRGARQMYTRFLRDPIPYLFDGGSVTEIARIARRELGLDDLSACIDLKMDALDKIVQDWEAAEFARRRDQYDSEFGAPRATGANDAAA